MWTVDYNNSEEFEAAIKTIMRTQVWVGGGSWAISPLLGLQEQISAAVAGAWLSLLSINCFSFLVYPWKLFVCAEQKSSSPAASGGLVLLPCFGTSKVFPQGSAVPLSDPLGILRAELEQEEAEIREMRFGSRRLRLVEMRGSAGTWCEAKINPESVSLQVP